MGDDVKITVIATGFRQQEMPERRERMLAEATLPGSRYDVPVMARPGLQRAAAMQRAESVPVTRVSVGREPAPAVQAGRPPVSQAWPRDLPAEESAEEFSARLPESAGGRRVTVAKEETGPTETRSTPSAPELLPVPASVFDDDFFRSPTPMARGEERPAFGDSRSREGHDQPTVRRVQEQSGREESVGGEVFHVQAPAESAVRTQAASFAAEAEANGPDELDIPAFLRRGN